MDEKQFVNSVKDCPKHLYYFTGNDLYTSEKCLKFLCKSVDASPEIIDLKSINKENPSESLGEYFYSFSLFGDKRVLVIDGFKVSDVATSVNEYFEDVFSDIPESLYVVLVAMNQEETRFSVAKGIQKYLDAANDKGESIIFLKKQGYDLKDQIKRLAKQEGCNIEQGAIDKLIYLRGDDSLVLEGEIKKLAASCDYTTISTKNVDEMCVRTVESGVYDMLRLLERGDEKGTLEILSDMLTQKTEPMIIAGTLNTAFINISRVKSLKKSGRKSSDMFTLYEYAKNDRKVDIAWKQADKYSESSVKNAINILYELDKDLKSSKNDKNQILEVAVCSLCSCSKI